MTPNAENDWFDDEFATFGDRLAGARDAAGLTQADLAKRIGVKEKTITAWENDVREPRANRLQMLAGILNVSMRWLLTGVGPGANDPSDLDTDDDLRAVLLDLRQVRSEYAEMGEKLGRLEKRLRGLVAGMETDQ